MSSQFKALIYLCLFTIASVAGVFWASKLAGGVLLLVLFTGAVAEICKQIIEDNKTNTEAR